MTDGRNSQSKYETRNPGLTDLAAAGEMQYSLGMLTNKEIGPIVQQVTEGTVTDPEIGPLDGTIQDAAYQISRGIRPMALLGHVPPNPTTMSRAYYRLVYLGGSQGAGALLPIPLLRHCHEITCSLLHAQLYLMGDS